MTVPTSPARRLPALSLLLVVAAISLGVLGMHALGSHTTAAPAQAGAAVVQASDVPGEHPTGAADAPAEHGSSGGHAGHGEPGGHEQMTMLCVFMLAAAELLLGLVAALRWSPRPWARLPRPVWSARPATRRWLPTGPPAEWRFSVVRC